MMDVTPREQFDRCLERAIAQAPSRTAGLFGPDSMVWRVNRFGAVILGGGSAALLQAAHPYVAHAVAEHSVALSDARKRFQRTFLYVFAVVFGDVDTARDAAVRVRDIHDTVHGTIDEHVGRFRPGDPYHANSRSAQEWVAATLMYTAVQLYEFAIGPLEEDEKDQLVRDHHVFCAAFGVPDDDLPENWASFERYWEEMVASDTLAVGRPAREIARSIMTPPTLASAPFYRWLHAFTAGLMPERLRQEYGLRWGRREKLLFGLTRGVLRAGVRLAPPAARYFPAYLDARRRLRGKSGPDPVGRLASRAFLAAALPRPSRWAGLARRLLGPPVDVQR